MKQASSQPGSHATAAVARKGHPSGQSQGRGRALYRLRGWSQILPALSALLLVASGGCGEEEAPAMTRVDGPPLADAFLSKQEAGTPDWTGVEDPFEVKRRQQKNRRRRLIFNNDGDDAIVLASAPTPAAMLAARTEGLEKTQVDSIFYSTNRGSFSLYSHRTEVAEVFTLTGHSYPQNIVPALLAQGTDPLQIIIDWCRKNNKEVFWSSRMNDMHDSSNASVLSAWKKSCPECLMSTSLNPPPHGGWSQVDYGTLAVRQQMLRIIDEVALRYDLDGIELDFFRHPAFLRTVAWGGHATTAQVATMNSFMRNVRAATERRGRARGRPILLAVRVPDSVPLCRTMGLDLETWTANGLVDLLIGGGYFRMNPWEDLVEFGRRRGAKVYADLSDARLSYQGELVKRSAEDVYRGRAARAWQAGVDGVYLFNMFNPKAPMLNQLGERAVLATLSKTYFATDLGSVAVSYNNPNTWVAGGREWQTLPVIYPTSPLVVHAGASAEVAFHVGDDLTAAAKAGLSPKATCQILAQAGGTLGVRLNGTLLAQPSPKNVWVQAALPTGVLRPGENHFRFEAEKDSGTGWPIQWTAGALPGTPWTHNTIKPGVVFAEQKKDGMLVADRGTSSGDYLYFSYPWDAVADQPSRAEAEVKVLAGYNGILLANGQFTERVLLYPDHIQTYYSGLRYDMDTQSAFHIYRVLLDKKDIQVFVDGVLRLDGKGKLTQSAAGLNAFSFGAANSPNKGESLWRAVRISTPRTAGARIYDLALTIQMAKP